MEKKELYEILNSDLNHLFIEENDVFKLGFNAKKELLERIEIILNNVNFDMVSSIYGYYNDIKYNKKLGMINFTYELRLFINNIHSVIDMKIYFCSFDIEVL